MDMSTVAHKTLPSTDYRDVRTVCPWDSLARFQIILVFRQMRFRWIIFPRFLGGVYVTHAAAITLTSPTVPFGVRPVPSRDGPFRCICRRFITYSLIASGR